METSDRAREVVRVEEFVEGGDRWWRIYVFSALVHDSVDAPDVEETAAWWRSKLTAYADERVREEREQCAAVRGAAQAVADFAWSAVKADCDESCAYLNGLLDNLRAALRVERLTRDRARALALTEACFIAAQVAELAERMMSPFKDGVETACEEIIHRLMDAGAGRPTGVDTDDPCSACATIAALLATEKGSDG